MLMSVLIGEWNSPSISKLIFPKCYESRIEFKVIVLIINEHNEFFMFCDCLILNNS